MAERRDVDVIVVGAGVAGSATAWWLARRGRSVVVVEQFEPGHSRGSSHGATRIFRLAYADTGYVGWAQEALPLWRELEHESGTTLVETTGAVDHGPETEVSPIATAMAALGVPHEVLTPTVATKRWPGMRFEGSVLFHPDGGRCLADAAVRAFQERAAARGATLHFGTGPASVAIERSGESVVVRAGDQTWRARVAVITAGAWLPKVAASIPHFARQLPPLRVTREQVQHFAGADDGWPSFIHHRRPWMYGLYSPGEGMKVAAHMAGRRADPDDVATDDPAARADVARYVEQWFPGLDPTPIHPATCLYTTTPNEKFVLERIGPIVVGSPCSGHGFKFAPLIGRILADLADLAFSTK